MPGLSHAEKILKELETVRIVAGWIDANGSARTAFANLRLREATGNPTPAIRDPATQALIARTLNYGRLAGVTAEGRKYPAIPARPFMEVAKEKFSAVYPKLAKKYLPQVLAGAISVEAFAKLVAVRVKDSIIEAMRDSGRYQPLSPATLKARRHGGSTPLIDTGSLINSVSFEVRFG